MKSKVIFMALLAFAFAAQAVPVSRDQARSIAQMWAARGKRLGVRMGTDVEDVTKYEPVGGRQFFAVRMKGGTVFTAGDTRMNPVLAFTRERIAKLDPKSPLYALLANSAQRVGGASARRQWATLQAKVDRFAGSQVPIESESEIDDVRVSPLLATKWGQSTVVGMDGAETACFNFYTPPTQTVIKEEMAGGYAETNESVNCVCGCVATAMAQLMRYWCWPQGECAAFENAGCSAPCGTSILRGVFWESGDFECLTVAQNPTMQTNLTTVAGIYDWTNMLEVPDHAAVEGNCKAIGKLTYDCGVAVGMDYNLAETGGSGILVSESQNIVNALKNRFTYANAILCTADGLTSSDSVRQKVIFANLDAKCPVLLLITGDGGHAVVGDGYGFDDNEGEALPYVHLNMGWTGQCDVWYNLPYVNTAENPENFSGFNTIAGVVYNVFTNTTGWIISGRVLDAEGHPVSGAKVTLRDESDAVVGTCESEAQTGIYAFSVPDGERQYDVIAENAYGTMMADRLVDITNDNVNGSNSWGNDLTLVESSVKVTGTAGEQHFASLDNALRAATNAGDRVEILHATSLRRDAFLGNDLTLTADGEQPPKIKRQGGATIAVTNGVAVLTNLAFEVEATSPIRVESNATVTVAGRMELDDIASMTPGIVLANGAGFVLTGELTSGLTISSPTNSAGGVFGTYSCGLDVAEISAKRIVTTDPGLVGKADDGKLVWQDAEEVDPLVAVCYQDADPARYYRTIDNLFAKLGTGEVADIVVTRAGCRLSQTLTVTGNASIRGEADGLSIAVSGDKNTPQFTVPTGASLVVSNLTFVGYEGVALFKVTGGGLTLEDGTTIDGAVGTGPTHSGAVALRDGGTVTVRPGAKIVNCRADRGNGGAIWVSNGGCTLNLEGGEITGCRAAQFGGGIYVYGGSSVNVSGTVTVSGNSSGNNLSDDIYLMNANCSFNLVGELSGSVGVRYSGSNSIPGNLEGESFIAVDPSLDSSVVAQSCEAFFNDTSGELVAGLSEDRAHLVWAVPPPVTGEVEPDAAYDLVIYNDGTPQAVTNYYDSFEHAYASLTNDATIVVLGVEILLDDVTVTRKVLIRTDDSEGLSGLGLYRAAECKFEIAAGGSLTLEDIVMSGIYVDEEDPEDIQVFGGTGTLLYVKDGGSLTLGDGAFVCDVNGDGGRACGGVVVWNGEFRMLPGSTIDGCSNDYPLHETAVVTPANVGVGGGLLVDGGTAYLEGGSVIGCRAARAAGVYIGNKSKVYISGDVDIDGNYTHGWARSDLTVEDKSELLVTNAFTDAYICVADGIQCDTNVIGRVPSSALPDGIPSAIDYVQTAACFCRDDNASVRGRVVTNDTEALIVWSWALKDGVYVDEDGNEYRLVAEPPVTATPPDSAPTPNGEEQVSAPEGTDNTQTGNQETLTSPETPTRSSDQGPREWKIEYHTPTPIALKSMRCVSGSQWELVFTNRVKYCNYRLIWTDNLAKGFTSTGAWEHAVGPAADPVWTTNVLMTGSGSWFWRAEGTEGTNMVPPQVEQ